MQVSAVVIDHWTELGDLYGKEKAEKEERERERERQKKKRTFPKKGIHNRDVPLRVTKPLPPTRLGLNI